MRDNLRLYRKMLTAAQGFLPDQRITRLRNLAFLASGLFLAGSVHLGKVARKWPFAGKVVSLTNRLRRFLKNGSVICEEYYRPLAEKLLSSFQEPWQEVRLILDTTKVGTGHRMSKERFCWSGTGPVGTPPTSSKNGLQSMTG